MPRLNKACPLMYACMAFVAVLSSCAPSLPPADTNRDGVLSDKEMEQFRRQQEVRGITPGAGHAGNSTGNQALKSIRAAREAAGTANTFRSLFSWF